MIRNYLGFPRGISGGVMATRVFQQSTMFGADVIFMNRAVSLSTDGHHHVVSASDGSQMTAKTAVIATGVRYCPLGIAEVEALVGAGVFYGVSGAGGSEAQTMRGRRVFLVGAGNSAGRILIPSRDGRPETSLVWKDTVLVRAGETVDILLEVTNPGLWMAHYHIAEHAQSGMMFSFDVRAQEDA